MTPTRAGWELTGSMKKLKKREETLTRAGDWRKGKVKGK